MITPDQVIEDVVDVLNTNKAAIKIKGAVELSEDVTHAMQPPYAGAFQNFEQEANQEISDTSLLGIPVEIKVVFFSSKKKTAAESLAECMQMAMTALPLIRTFYTYGAETTELRLRKQPMDILAKKADQSVLQLNMYYEMDSLP